MGRHAVVAAWAIAALGLTSSCQTGGTSKANSGSGSGSGSGVGVVAAKPVPPPIAPPANEARPVPPLPSPLPGRREDVTANVGTAVLVAIGDFLGDGHRELALADADKLRIVTPAGKELAILPAAGGIQVLVAADVDGDGRAELIAGWGQSRDHRDAPMQIVRYRLDRDHLVADQIAAPNTERAEIVAIVPSGRDELIVAYYSNKYMVKSATMRHTAAGWTATPLAELRMATSYARGDVDGDGKPDLVVGRVYGDAQGVDGDAFVLAADGKRTPVPTTRGVHGIAIADGTIFIGDGWHQNYAEKARGLLTAVHHDATGFHAELVDDTQGQFQIHRIVPAKINGRTVIIALGSHYVRAYTHEGGTWKGVTIAGAARDVAVGDLDGEPGDEILITGDKTEIVHL